MEYKQQLLESIQFFETEHAETFPVQYKDKKPLPGKSWKDLQYTFPQWEELIHSERYNVAIRGGTRENVVILDFDSPLHFHYLKELQPTVEYLFTESLVIDTPGHGSYHIVFRAPVPVESSKDTIHEIDILADSKYAVTVPSVHPNGGQYTFANDNPIVSISPEHWEELQRILNIRPAKTPPPAPKVTAGSIDPEFTFYSLSPFYRDIIRDGIIPERYSHVTGKPDSSRADQAVITILVKNGFSVSDVIAVYSRYVHGKHKFRSRKRPERYIETSYAKAEDYYRENRKVTDYLIDLAWYAVPQLFRGRTSRSSIMVVRSLLWTMKRSDTVAVGLSVREIMLYTGIGNPTVQRAIKRLRNHGYVVKVKDGYYSRSAIYGLTVGFFQAIDSQKDKGNMNTHLHSIPLNDPLLDTEKDKGKTNPHLHSVSPDDSLPESEKDMFNVNTHLHSMAPWLLYDSLTIPLDVINNPLVDPLRVNDLLIESSDHRNVKALNRNSDLLIEYVNAHIGEEIPFSVLMKESGLSNRQTLKKKLQRLQLVSLISEGKRSGKTRPITVYTFHEPITDRKLDAIAVETGAKGSAEKRAERIKKERETYQNYLSDVIAPRIAERKGDSEEQAV